MATKRRCRPSPCMSVVVGIVLQTPPNAEQLIFREKTKRAIIAD
jgi:hypothetical protein